MVARVRPRLRGDMGREAGAAVEGQCEEYCGDFDRIVLYLDCSGGYTNPNL
jgi:hypothetical protein